MTTTAELVVYVKQSSVSHPLPRGSSLRVGRGSRVHIRVDDPSVSREHLVIHVGQNIEVEDLGSSNGTQLFPASQGDVGVSEGKGDRYLKPQRRYLLGPGDVLRIGSVPALLQVEAPAVAPNRSTRPPPEDTRLVLRDPEMRRLYDLAHRAAKSDIAVLIMGETGVGKELLAESIHTNSHRAGKKFLQLNCAAISEGLLESELFGHERGAFTGALAQRIGLLESTQGGTVFLDEIGEMPLSTQAKLLRVLEERRIRRLGSSTSITVDVRFVAATNRDIEKEIAAGRFRGDLYYRLSGIPLHIPPLRERPTEIEPLARHFLSAFCTRSRLPVPELSPAALQAMLAYPWPGNVRELKNAMERAPFLSGGGPLLPEHLPRVPEDEELFSDNETTDVFNSPFLAPSGADTQVPIVGQASFSAPPRSETAYTMREPPFATAPPLARVSERERILEALERCGGNQTRAARLLGVSRRTLINRLEEYDLPRPRKRRPS